MSKYKVSSWTADRVQLMNKEYPTADIDDLRDKLNAISGPHITLESMRLYARRSKLKRDPEATLARLRKLGKQNGFKPGSKPKPARKATRSASVAGSLPNGFKHRHVDYPLAELRNKVKDAMRREVDPLIWASQQNIPLWKFYMLRGQILHERIDSRK
jgi:hypothetical protein